MTHITTTITIASNSLQSAVAAGQTWLSSPVFTLPALLLLTLVAASGWGVYQRCRMPSNAKADRARDSL